MAVAVQVASRASSGFNTIANPSNPLYNGDTDGYANQSVSASVGVTPATDQELTAQYLKSRLNNQFDGSPDFDDRTITVDGTGLHADAADANARTYRDGRLHLDWR